MSTPVNSRWKRNFLIPLLINSLMSSAATLAWSNDQNATDDTSAQALYQQGLDLAHEHRCADAMPLFQQALQYNFQFADALSAISICYTRLNQDIEAIKAMERAVALDPEHGEYQKHLGVMYAALGDWSKAVTTLRRLRKVDPAMSSSLDGIMLLARIWPAQKVDGDWVFAAATPTDEAASLYTAAEQHMRSLNIEEAVRTMRKFIANNPEQTFGYIKLVQWYGIVNAPQPAVTLLEQYLEDFPAQPEILYMLGDLYLQLERVDDAITTWEQLKDIDMVLYEMRRDVIDELQ